ncbi:MAG: hypothetical protein ACU0BH_12735 [Paracoccaceae bacterium]|nr:hypothetical protein [Seohaeicola saemankumensis]
MVTLIGSAALAQSTVHATMNHAAMGHGTVSADHSPATQAYKVANDAMHSGIAPP